MYNENWKKEYLEYTNNSSNSVKMLKYVEKFENQFEHDLYDMTPSELIKIVSSCDTAEYARKIKVEIVRYLEYCRARKKIVINAAKVIKPTDWSKIISERKQAYYITDELYRSYLKRIENSGAGVYDASIIASIYNNIAGVRFFNLVHLRLHDIDSPHHKISLKDGREVTVEPYLIHLLMITNNICLLYTSRCV